MVCRFFSSSPSRIFFLPFAYCTFSPLSFFFDIFVSSCVSKQTADGASVLGGFGFQGYGADGKVVGWDGVSFFCVFWCVCGVFFLLLRFALVFVLLSICFSFIFVSSCRLYRLRYRVVNLVYFPFALVDKSGGHTYRQETNYLWKAPPPLFSLMICDAGEQHRHRCLRDFV